MGKHAFTFGKTVDIILYALGSSDVPAVFQNSLVTFARFWYNYEIYDS